MGRGRERGEGRFSQIKVNGVVNIDTLPECNECPSLHRTLGKYSRGKEESPSINYYYTEDCDSTINFLKKKYTGLLISGVFFFNFRRAWGG